MITLELIKSERASHDNKPRRLFLKSAITVCNLTVSNQEYSDSIKPDETAQTITLNLEQMKMLHASIGYIVQDMTSRQLDKS